MINVEMVARINGINGDNAEEKYRELIEEEVESFFSQFKSISKLSITSMTYKPFRCMRVAEDNAVMKLKDDFDEYRLEIITEKEKTLLFSVKTSQLNFVYVRERNGIYDLLFNISGDSCDYEMKFTA